MGNKEAKNRHSYKELTPKELHELKEQTKFSEKEIRDWYAGFYHDCPDGELDKKKFIHIFQKFYVRDHRATCFSEYVFGMFDKDNTGTINFSEFLLAIASSTQGDIDKRLGLAFDMYDVSGNGELDQEELANLILAMYNLVGETNRKGDRDPKKRAIQMIREFDKDGDKKLSRTEFINECKNDEKLIYMLAPKL